VKVQRESAADGARRRKGLQSLSHLL